MPEGQKTEISIPAESEPAPAPDIGWTVAAAVVLPVIWGVVVHVAFKKIRGDQKTTQPDSDSVWPDYQI